MVVGVIGAVGWSWLHLWDHYHPAAPAGRRLWTGEPAERIAAIGDLGRVGRDDIDVAIPALVESLGDRDATVRAAAASAFVSVVPGTRGEKPRREHISKAASALVESLQDPQPPVRAAAAEAVWMVMSVGQVPAGEPVLDQVRTALIERLGDPDASVRLAAIRGLGSVGPKVADEPPAPLLAALEDEAEKNRDAAAFALASFHRGLPPLLPSLVRSLDGGREQSRAGLLKILEHVRPPQFTPAAFPGLVAALDSRDPQVIRLAVADLVAFKEAAGPVVADLARTLDRLIEARSKCPAALDRPTSDPLVAIAECLESLAPGARSQDEAVAALANLLRLDVDQHCRVAAAKALGRFRPDPELFTTLIERINDHDAQVRIAVMWAIDHADFGAGYHVPKALSIALEDDSAEIRGAAAAALGHSGVGLDPIIPALLRHAEHDADNEVRAICWTVLEVCTGPPKVTAAVVPELSKALASSDARLREALCTILSRFGREAVPAIPALINALNDRNAKDASVYRWMAAKALSDIVPGTPQADQAITALIESLAYPDQRGPTASIRALAVFGPKAAAAIPHLQALQDSKDPGVKDDATQALAKIKGARKGF